jgi:hypothetical protein
MAAPALARRIVLLKACPSRIPVRERIRVWRPRGRRRNGGTPTLIPEQILAAKTEVDGGEPWGIGRAVAIPLGGEAATVARSDPVLRSHQRCFRSKPKRSLAARRLNSASAAGSLPMRQSARLT